MKNDTHLILSLEDDLIDFDLQIETLSLEEGYITNIIETTKNAFGSLTNKITSLLTSGRENSNWIQELVETRGELELSKFIKNEARNVNKTVDGVKFMRVEDRGIMTIPGLNTRMVFLVNDITKPVLEISKNYKTILDDIDTRIAKFIGNPEVRKSFRKPNSAVEDTLDFNKKVMDLLQKNFDKTKLTEVVSLKEVFGNNNEYVSSVENIAKLNDSFTEKELLNINKMTNQIHERVEILHGILAKEEVVVSKESLQGLVDALDAVANYVTIVSNLYYLNTKMIEVVRSAKKIYDEK